MVQTVSFIDLLSESFIEYYKPHYNIGLDESMVKFMGHSSMKQCMRDNLIKQDYKIWTLCDEPAYNLKFHIYDRKTKSNVESGLEEMVVLDFMNGLGDENHIFLWIIFSIHSTL